VLHRFVTDEIGSQDIIQDFVTEIVDGRPQNCGSIPDRGKNLFSLPRRSSLLFITEEMGSRDVTHDFVPTKGDGGPQNCVSIPDGAKFFSLFQGGPASYVDHPVSHLWNRNGSSPGKKIGCDVELQLNFYAPIRLHGMYRDDFSLK
jgi:hypothetical protein